MGVIDMASSREKTDPNKQDRSIQGALMRILRRVGAIATIALFFISTSGGAAQQKYSAEDAFQFLGRVLSDGPITTVDKFREIEPEIRKIGFTTRDSSGWNYSNLGDVVTLLAFPEQGQFFVEYIPGTPSPFGDASLAALINKAPSISFENGNSVELGMGLLRVLRQGRTVETTEYLSFKLSGGRWWKTTRVIQWSK
jgi:hypothetical protein